MKEMRTTKTIEEREKGQNRVLTIVFLLMIFGITIAGFFVPVKERSESENRNLAQKPEFTLSGLFAKENDKRFTTQYESYITDQFIARDTWIGIKTQTERLLGKTDINGVYFADDGYLITKTDADKVDAEREEKNIAYLTEFVAKYEELLGKGKVDVMLVPTAADILADKLPAFTSEYDQAALLERMEAALGADAWIDVRENLQEHADEYLYYRTDHHWTALGAYYAYQAWAEHEGLPVRDLADYTESVASDEFYGTLYSKVNLPMDADTVMIYEDGMKYRVEYDSNRKYMSSLFSMDRLKDKDKYMVYLDGNHAQVDIVTENKNGKTLLVVKDSYAHTFLPFLAQDYERIVMIDFRYLKMPVSALVQTYGVTDMLVMYNATNFVEDVNLYMLEK